MNFFRFFTNVCNIFGDIVFLSLRAISYEVHTRVMFFAVVNAIVHYILPIAVVVDWCIDPPSTALTRRDSATWLILPIAYVVSTMVRGAIVHWYPYPFMNAEVLGYAGVAPYLLAIVVFSLLVSWLLVVIGSRLRARTA